MTAPVPVVTTKYTYIYMGIRGLAGYLKWKTPSARKNIVWSAYAGQRWAIDCSCLLYRAKAAGLAPITVIAGLIVRMRAAGVTPVIVFDGRTPAAKAETVEARRAVRETAHREIAEIRTELTTTTTLTEAERADREIRAQTLQARAPHVSSRDRDDIKKFLYAAGVLFITATGEADDVIAYLARRGEVSAVISTDMDMLARGVPLLVIPETHDATVLTAMSLSAILTELRLTYRQFVDACVVMGTDYNVKGWRTQPPPVAIDMARRGIDWTMVDASGSVCAGLESSVAALAGDRVVWEEIMAEAQRDKWAAGAPPKEPENLLAFCEANRWPMDWVRVLLA